MTPNESYIDYTLNSLIDCLTPEVAHKIALLKIDPKVQARFDELADKSTNGELTSEEKLEYEKSIQTHDFLALLQASIRLQEVSRK